MKRITALILAALLALSAFGALAASQSIPIDKKNFPDPNFRNLVKGVDYDLNEDGKLSLTEIKKINGVEVTDCAISDLTGIEYFTNLTALTAGVNKLTKLDVSKNTKLQTLSCGYNKLTKLDVSRNKKLKYFFCANNNLKTLTLGTQKYLATLNCSENKRLARLDIGKCKVLLSIVKKGSMTKKDGYVEWHTGKDPEYNYLRIPAACTLYNGKKVLYKDK